MSGGNYRVMTQLFNMPSGDYKRFLSFLRKHDCGLSFRPFRELPLRKAYGDSYAAPAQAACM